MDHASVKTLCKLALYTKSEEEFRLYLSVQKFSDLAIDTLWTMYNFLLNSTFLPDYVKENFLFGEDLQTVAQRHNFSVSKVRSAVFRYSQKFESLFPFNAYEKAVKGQLTANDCDVIKRKINRLWRLYADSKSNLREAFAVDIFDYVSEPRYHQISDEQFEEARSLLRRLSNSYLQVILHSIPPESLEYCLYLLTTANLSPLDQQRAQQLRNFIWPQAVGEELASQAAT